MSDFDRFRATLGLTLRAHRKAHGYSQHVLADRLGRSVQWISDLERAVGTPSLAVLGEFAAEYGTSVQALLWPAAAGLPAEEDRVSLAVWFLERSPEVLETLNAHLPPLIDALSAAGGGEA